MIIHIVKYYLKLADSGFFDPVLCEINEDHGRLFANIDDNDKVFLYCLACDFKIWLGINSIQDMFKSILIFENYH